MSWLKKLVKKIVNLVTGKKDSPTTLANSMPRAAAASSFGGLTQGIISAVHKTANERVQGEIDANRSSQAPLPSKTFSDTVAEEYDKWFKTTHAGIMSPAPTGLPALKTALRAYMFKGWGAGFAAYWQSTVWTPSGIYTGGVTINASTQGTSLQSQIDSSLRSQFQDMDSFARKIAELLHTYTTGLTVQATLSVPPNTKVETVQ